MRIALIGDLPKSDSPSGPERFASELFVEMKKHEDVWFYEYICSGTPCPWAEKIFAKLEIDAEKQIIRGGLFSLLIHFIRNKWDVLHLVTYLRAAALFLLISKAKKVRTAYTLHGVIAFEDQTKSNLRLSYILKNRIFEKLISLVTDKIAAVSSSVAKIFSGIFPGVNGKITIIPNGIRAIDRQTALIPSEGPLKLITFTGSIKGSDFLAPLIRFVADNPDKYYLSIVGSTGIELPSVNNVQHKDKQSHEAWKEELCTHNIYINARQYESFSISALEALSSGLCVFLHNEIGLAENLVDGKEYINYSINAPENLFAKLKELHENRNVLMEYRLSAINAAKRFSVERECGDYLSFYRKLMVL